LNLKEGEDNLNNILGRIEEEESKNI